MKSVPELIRKGIRMKDSISYLLFLQSVTILFSSGILFGLLKPDGDANKN